MPSSIPALSFVFSLLSALLCFGLPAGLGVWVCRRHKGAGHAIMIGAFCFIVGATVLEQLLHSLVLGAVPNLRQNPLLYGLYGCLAAGLFEETARLLGLRALCKRDAAPDIGLAYGVGHGGIEAVMIAGLGIVNNLIVMYMINSGQGESLVAGYTGDTLTLAQQQLTAMAETPSPVYLAAGLERAYAIALHIALSMLIWMVVTRRLPMWGYGLAILLHALTNLPAALYQTGILTGIWPTELLGVLLTAGVVLLVARLYRRPAKT